MPRRTETIDLEEEEARLENKLDELADEVAEWHEKSDSTIKESKLEELTDEGNSVEQELAGVKWALNPDEDEDREPYEEITLGSLTAGEYARVGDYTIGIKNLNQDKVSKHMEAENARRTVFAAAGIAEAPFLETTENTELYEKYQEVSRKLSPQFVYWIEQRVDELTSPDVEGNGFAARVAERIETETPNTPTAEQS